jgi:hypothetical protein
MKRLMFLFCGICWLGFGLGFGFFLLQYLGNGAGSSEIAPAGRLGVSPAGTLIGLVHFAGFFLLSAFCFLVGIGLFSYGLVSPRENERD